MGLFGLNKTPIHELSGFLAMYISTCLSRPTAEALRGPGRHCVCSFAHFFFFTRKPPLVYLFRPGTCKIVLTNERYVCCCVVRVHVCCMICVYVYVPMCLVPNVQIFAPAYGSLRNLWVCSSAALCLIFWEKVSSWTWILFVIWGRLASGLPRAACPAPASPGQRPKAWSSYMGTGDPDSEPYIFSGTPWWVGLIPDLGLL